MQDYTGPCNHGPASPSDRAPESRVGQPGANQSGAVLTHLSAALTLCIPALTLHLQRRLGHRGAVRQAAEVGLLLECACVDKNSKFLMEIISTQFTHIQRASAHLTISWWLSLGMQGNCKCPLVTSMTTGLRLTACGPCRRPREAALGLVLQRLPLTWCILSSSSAGRSCSH